MSYELISLLIVGIFIIAVLYSSVGHAGASGYIAVMSLLAIAPETIKPTALCLNILVGSIASWQFYRAGHFSWSLFWPFALLAAPFSFLGGQINLPTQTFKFILGLILIYSALRFFMPNQQQAVIKNPALPLALGTGASIGLVSGLTGTGGGIFLTPLLLLMGWADAKRAAAVSALFVLSNSIFGLAGNYASTKSLPSFIWALLITAGIGGTIGAYLGSRRIQASWIKKLLAIVLLIAAAKLMLT